VRVENLELDSFGPQNVLDDLVIVDRMPTVSESRIHVELPANNGLDGSFDCAEVIVTAVEPHLPGPHSVYGDSGSAL